MFVKFLACFRVKHYDVCNEFSYSYYGGAVSRRSLAEADVIYGIAWLDNLVLLVLTYPPGRPTSDTNGTLTASFTPWENTQRRGYRYRATRVVRASVCSVCSAGA